MALKRSPALPSLHTRGLGTGKNDWRATASPEDFVVESWSQGFMVGALLIMACITVANMRRGVLLHKLILAEQLFAMMHGTFCFMAFRGYGWYLSSTASFLYLSWLIHNFVAWLKIRPFFLEPRSMFKPRIGRWVARIYLSTLALSTAPILLQIVDNFLFFNNINNRYKKVRPYEPIMRDPWWVFTCVTLFHVISKCYGTGTLELIKRSPRFGILLAAIILAMIFTIMDIIASIDTGLTGSTDGINPWWKLSLVFKCLTDTIMLDDFKTELKRLGIKRIQKEERRRQSVALVLDEQEHDALDGPYRTDDTYNRPPSNQDAVGDVEQIEFGGTLRRGPTTNGSTMSPSTTNTNHNSRAKVGGDGIKISHLPGLVGKIGKTGKKGPQPTTDTDHAFDEKRGNVLTETKSSGKSAATSSETRNTSRGSGSSSSSNDRYHDMPAENDHHHHHDLHTETDHDNDTITEPNPAISLGRETAERGARRPTDDQYGFDPDTGNGRGQSRRQREMAERVEQMRLSLGMPAPGPELGE